MNKIYGYVYLTYDSLNNKYYIGQHKYNNIKPIPMYTDNYEEQLWYKSFKDSHGFEPFMIDGKYLGSGLLLNRAINKYGKQYFYILDILDIAYSKEELDDVETQWIRWYRNNGYDLYNIIDQAYGGKTKGFTGHHMSEEQKRKLSELHKGKIVPEEVKYKISKTLRGRFAGERNPMYGKHHTEETKQKQSKALKSRKYTEQEYESHRKSRKPWHHTEETKLNMSKKAKGRVSPMKGVPKTAEQKSKIRESINKFYNSPKGEEARRINSEKHKGKKLNKETRKYE